MVNLLRHGDEDPKFARIREMLGVGPYDDVEVRGSVTAREDGRKVYWTPTTAEEFGKLKTAPAALLRELCLVPWEEPHGDGMMVWLFPAEWFEFIPEGYEVVTFRGARKPFAPGGTVDEQWLGCLPYGFVRKEP